MDHVTELVNFLKEHPRNELHISNQTISEMGIDTREIAAKAGRKFRQVSSAKSNPDGDFWFENETIFCEENA